MAEQGKDKTTSERTEMQVNQVVFDSANAANILHLSDLHFGADTESAAAERWYGQLVDDLSGELRCKHLDAVIISGDIGNFSEPGEYIAAHIFIDLLCENFGVGKKCVAIVPGNHDLNRKDSKNGYQLKDKDKLNLPPKDGYFIELGDGAIRLRDENAYPMRFNHFSRFYENIFGTPYPFDPGKQVILYHLPELNLLIVGFNSVWEADHHFKKRISINPDAVEFALGQIRDNSKYEKCLKVAVWHHPLDSEGEDRIKDRGFMQCLAQAGFRLCLHGHIHKSYSSLFRYDMTLDGRKIDIVGAGTFGAPVKEWVPGYPLQYNLLRLSQNILRVETRCRREINGTWGPDHLWRQGRGKSNLSYYDISLSHSAQPEKHPEPIQEKDKFDPELEEQIQGYYEKARSLHEELPLLGFKTVLRVPILIKDIYIALRAMVDRRLTGDSFYADADDAEKCLRGHNCEEISIPEAFRIAKSLKKRGILILGDPGSGKTTHLKRVFLWCLQGGLEKLGLPAGTIPVFLPLRELQNLNAGLDAFIQKQLDQPHLATPEGFGKALLKRGNLLFLLDGLDEVSDTTQRVRVSRWIDNALRIHKTCKFMVTCRFAGYTRETRLNPKFLEMHMRPLTTEQAEDFIRTWYRLVETGRSADPNQAQLSAGEQAENLINRLKEPAFRSMRIFTMTRNPLLLANLCLVHRDRGGQLPTRRARLYDECIHVLLELWKESKGFKSKVGGATGRRVLQPAAYWLHQKEGRTRAKKEELVPVIEPALKRVGWKHGSAGDFLRIVRDESGLLTGWSDDQYGFMHLGFQEYLAALQIKNLAFRNFKVLKQLAENFGNSWWQEVILLLLAQHNPCLFEDFMKEVIKHDDFISHSNLIDMCLEESAETTLQPFLELVEAEAGKDREVWERQLAALRIIERIDRKAIEYLAYRLRNHPFGDIRQWIEERVKASLQKIITPKPSGYELVFIPGGVFMRGSYEKEEGRYNNEGPVLEVTVSDFYMGRYPVTNEEYKTFLEANPKIKEPYYWGDRNYNQPRQPVVGVGRNDAEAYAKWAGLQLPSEAQWEYACRAVTSTRYYNGNSEADLDRAGWYGKNSSNKLHPVGEKEPNAYGLYDMHGNVWEWCEDHWHDDYNGAPDDGSAWVDKGEGVDRVVRGGSWYFVANYCRSAYRGRRNPDTMDGSNGGLRLVCLPVQQCEPDKSRQGGA